MSKQHDDEETKKFQEMFEKSVEHWLDKKYSQFGRWTLGTIGVAVFMGLLQLVVWMNAKEKPEFPKPPMSASEVRH